MKKIFHILFLVILYASVVNAAQMRHFNIDVKEPISEDRIVAHFSEWFSLSDNSSFLQAKVLTDNQGNKHYRYDQYIGGVLVEGGQILVHTSNGFVQNVNGMVLESIIEKSPIANRYPVKASKNNLNEDIVIIPTDNETSFRYAYKRLSEELGSYVYIDTENGDTLDIILFVYDAQSKITTNTIYSGRQQLTIERSGQNITYNTTNPKIITVNSSNVSFLVDTSQENSFYTSQIQSANPYSETVTDSLNSYIASITFELTNNDWYGGSTGAEGINDYNYPDLYVKITNSSGSLVYKSIVFSNWKYINDPVKNQITISINPMIKLDGSKYTVKLYDEDTFSDDEAGGFTISSTTKGVGALSTSNFKATVNVTGQPIRDVHWGMEKTLAFYKNVLHRNSYDGNGAAVYQFVNPFRPLLLPNNAFARSSAPCCMVYGLGDGITYSPWVALDIVAHEFTHIVTAHNICDGLEYKGESGALNEGFSDIFAILTEGYTFGTYDWTFGENVTLKCAYSRSLKDPKSGEYAQPTTYGKGPWKDPLQTKCDTCDNGGVHINSSILNYWFYLLCNGGNGVNDNNQSYNVKGIGITKATEITYNTWMYRLAGKSTFADARESFIAEVISKYGKDSQEHQSVVNAWYAVGVGDKYAEESETTNYVIITQRKTSSNWFYMTSDLGSANTKRYQAVDAGTANIADVKTSNLDSKYYWQVEENKLHNAAGYSAWTSGNSACFDTNGKDLTIQKNDDNTYTFSFLDGEDTRRLALNATAGNDYFAYYKGANHTYKLTLIKEDENALSTSIEITPINSQEPKATKILHNGQIYILRGEKAYTVQGQEVK